MKCSGKDNVLQTYLAHRNCCLENETDLEVQALQIKGVVSRRESRDTDSFSVSEMATKENTSPKENILNNLEVSKKI